MTFALFVCAVCFAAKQGSLLNENDNQVERLSNVGYAALVRKFEKRLISSHRG